MTGTGALAPELALFKSLISERLGFRLEDAESSQLVELLHDRMEVLGCSGTDYLQRLRNANSEEWGIIAEHLTIGETYFFRNPDHFRAFTETVLPDRLQARHAERTLRILSAGCASGEEAYTLAILAQEPLAQHDGWSLDLLGVDINAAFLQKARNARYSSWSLRATSEEMVERYFRPEGREFCLSEAIRKRVAFERRNLLDDEPGPAGSFDVIFCRNVLIYFSAEAIRSVIARFSRMLSPGGYLFLGAAETLRGLTKEFHLCHSHGTFYYQLKQEPVDETSGRGGVVPILAESDATWVDAINLSAERIAKLADTKLEQPGSAPLAAPEERGGWDRSLAMQLFYEERFTEVTELIQARFAPDPDALLLRAAALTNLARIPEAAEACRAILRQDEFNAGAHYLLALCHEHEGDREGARRHDEAASYLDPSFAMPRLHLGLIAKRMHDRSGARREIALAQTLLATEDSARILLFGGGFTREALVTLCKGELGRLEARE